MIHVVGERSACEVLVGIPEGKSPLCVEYMVIDGGMMINRVIIKQDGCEMDYFG